MIRNPSSHWRVASSKRDRLRRGLATSLLRAAQQLIRLADRLARKRHMRMSPEIEFYAEAGAPEGALYVDGQLLGKLSGVTRL